MNTSLRLLVVTLSALVFAGWFVFLKNNLGPVVAKSGDAKTAIQPGGIIPASTAP